MAWQKKSWSSKSRYMESRLRSTTLWLVVLRIADKYQVASRTAMMDPPYHSRAMCIQHRERGGKRCRVGSKQAGCSSGRTRVKLELLTSYRWELPCRILA